MEFIESKSGKKMLVTMEFIESKSGKKMLVLDQFKYYFTANRWRCYKKDCSASVYLNEKNDEIVKRKGNFF